MIVAFSYPRVRSVAHDRFEKSHRTLQIPFFMTLELTMTQALWDGVLQLWFGDRQAHSAYHVLLS